MAILYSYEGVYKPFGFKRRFYIKVSVVFMVVVGFVWGLLCIRCIAGFCWDDGISGI